MPPEQPGPSECDLPFLYQQQFMRTTALVGAAETYQDRSLARSQGVPQRPVAGLSLGSNQSVSGSVDSGGITPHPYYFRSSSPAAVDEWQPNPSWVPPEGTRTVLPRSRAMARRWCPGCGDEVVATCPWYGPEVCENHQDRDRHPWGGSGAILCIHGPAPETGVVSSMTPQDEETWEVPQEETCEVPHLSDGSEQELSLIHI